MKGQFFNIIESIPEIMNAANIEKCIHDFFELSGEKIIKADNVIETAMGAALCNKRTLFLTNTIYAEIFRKCSLMRIPLVGISFSGTFGKKTFENSAMFVHHCGWMLALPENLQEAIDMIIQSYYISESKKVLLPCIVNIDDYSQAEVVQVPSHQSISTLLKKFKLTYNLESKEKHNLRTEFDNIFEYIVQQQLAMKNAEKTINDLSAIWYKKFRRHTGLYEEYKTEDAEYILFVYGYNSVNAKAAIDELREKGEKVGLIRIKFLRPFPQKDIKSLTEGKKIGILDNAFFVGSGGVLSNELKDNVSFVTMRRLGEKDFIDIFNVLKKSEKGERFWV